MSGTTNAPASESVVSTPTEEQVRHCSFCKKSNREVAVMVATDPVFICDECVCLCMGILATHFRDKFTCKVLSPAIERVSHIEAQPDSAGA